MIKDWINRWNIPDQALIELNQLMGIHAEATCKPNGSESAVQQEIRIAASRRGERLWRNNVGAIKNNNNRLIRFGLANESSSVNEIIKSSDLIGITPHVIVNTDVGHTIGIFTSVEVKKPGWKYTGKGREKAQLAWLNLVISLGGRAQFATQVGDVW